MPALLSVSNMKSLYFLCFALLFLLSCEKEDPIPVIEGPNYVSLEIQGFTITMRESEQGHPDIDAALGKLDVMLAEINGMLREPFLEIIRFRPIWLKLNLVENGAAWYHPNRDWLVANGHNPQKVFCIEISNARNFVSWTELNQPYMVLHEMAHLLHHQFFGYDYHAVESAFQQAQSSGIYESVPYFNGHTITEQRAYALNNSMEYYAELTEAYFGENDYYPFNYDDLKEFDPAGFALMESTWGPVHGKSHTAGIDSPPQNLQLDPFYEKYLDASGLPVVTSWIVYDEALVMARDIVNHMISELPQEVLEKMIELNTRVGIIGAKQRTTEMPEYRDLYEVFPGTDWDNRARGLGPTIARPLASGGEENLLRLPGDRYPNENILVHEFAHGIHLMGLYHAVEGFEEELVEAYNEAIAAGLWQNTYAATNHYEYFAEGVQYWFNVNGFSNPANGTYGPIASREELMDYDPRLYAILEVYFPAEDIVY